jgi:hypothetical protein
MIPLVDDLVWRCMNRWFRSPVVLLEWNGVTASASSITLEKLVMVRSEEHASQGGEDSLVPTAFNMTAIPLKGFNLGPRREGVCETIEICHLSPGWHLLRLTLYAEGDSVPLACSQIQVKVPARSPWWEAWKVPLGILSIALLLLFLRAHRASA